MVNKTSSLVRSHIEDMHTRAPRSPAVRRQSNVSSWRFNHKFSDFGDDSRIVAFESMVPHPLLESGPAVRIGWAESVG